jgi:hypothetical protein
MWRPLWVAVAILAVGLCAPPSWSADQPAKTPADEDETAQTVELFAAMESGDIDVKFIPKDSTRATVLIENKLDRPLRIRLPEAFAGVPVQRQMGMGGMGMGGMGGGMGMGGMGGGMGGMGGGMGQGMGGGMGGMGMGGMGGMGMGGMGMGGMGGMFNVAPGKVEKLKVNTVCLEHGKPEPTPRMAYKMVPIESFTTKPEVIELCKLVGTGKIPQSAAQAAAWHFTDGMSWQQLAQKVGVQHLIGPSEPYFSPVDIQAGMRIAAETLQRVRDNPRYREQAESLSQK